MQVGLKIGIAVHLAFVFCRQPNEAGRMHSAGIPQGYHWHSVQESSGI